MIRPTKIILHHSATKDSGTVSWNAIRKYHIEQCKWDDIGYHFGVELINGHYEILVGRTLDTVGAHTSGHNSDSIGICFVGDFDQVLVPPGQWEAGLKLVRWLTQAYSISRANIYGHRNFAPKTCPGINFDIGRFIKEL
jgi:hypothetical protein